MVPGALATVTPFLAARPERGRTWASKPTGRAIEMPVGTILRSSGAEFDVLVDGGQKVGAGGGGRGVVRQGKVMGMRQAHHFDLDGLDTLHSAASALVG